MVGRLVQKKGRHRTKGETMHKTIQKPLKKHRIHKVENKNTQLKTNIKESIKNNKHKNHNKHKKNNKHKQNNKHKRHNKHKKNNKLNK